MINKKLKLNILGIKLTFSLPGWLYKKAIYNHIYKQSENCKNIYVLLTTSGEIYLLSLLLKDNINLSETLFVATRKYHIDILKMFLENPKYIYFPEAFELYNEADYQIKYRNKIIYNYLNAKFINDLCTTWLNKENLHYISTIKSYINCKNEFDTKKPKQYFPVEIKNELIAKLTKIGLNTDKFIFFAPEAKTCNPIDISFWKDLYEKFSALGFDIYTNSIGANKEFAFAKYADLSVTEANLCAKLSKGIIALRSGLCEPFTLYDLPVAVLYNDIDINNEFIKTLDAKFAMQTFTLKKYPYITDENLSEYNIKEYEKGNLAKEIADKIISWEKRK